MIILTNAFSINMLNDTTKVSFQKITKSEATSWLQYGFISAVGHADTAAIFADEIGIEVSANRITVELSDCPIIVGQYKGPRLLEGTTTLPSGSVIEWWLVQKIPRG